MLTHHTLKTYEGMELILQAFLTSALECGENPLRLEWYFWYTVAGSVAPRADVDVDANLKLPLPLGKNPRLSASS
jgi:hypothetical protein